MARVREAVIAECSDCIDYLNVKGQFETTFYVVIAERSDSIEYLNVKGQFEMTFYAVSSDSIYVQ